jgi:hypothetical protein
MNKKKIEENHEAKYQKTPPRGLKLKRKINSQSI